MKDMKIVYAFWLLMLSMSLLVSPVRAELAPDIRIQTDSQTLQLKNLRGQVIYLDFWASWCVPCRESFPWMNNMEKKYGSKGLKVVTINLDENRKNAQAFLQKYPAGFTVGFDPGGASAETFKVKGMPSSYLIDRNGHILFSHVGFRQKDRAELESAIRSALTK